MKDKKRNMKDRKDKRTGRGALRKKYERGPRTSLKVSLTADQPCTFLISSLNSIFFDGSIRVYILSSRFSEDLQMLQGITDKKLKGQLKAKEKLYGEATLNAAQVEQVSPMCFPCSMAAAAGFIHFLKGGPAVLCRRLSIICWNVGALLRRYSL